MHPIDQTVRIRLCHNSAQDPLFSKRVLPDRARGGIFRNFSGAQNAPESGEVLMRQVFASIIAGLMVTSASAQLTSFSSTDRYEPTPIELGSYKVMSVSTLGQRIHDTEFNGFGQRGCINDASHTDPTFSATNWTAQAGFAEREIMAATYTLPASAFPIKIEVLRGLFVTLNAIEPTTTEWSVLVWEGTPETGTLVAEYSSDDIILPHLQMPPGTNGTLIEVSVDPGDPNQIFILNTDGSNQFSIGFRIDKHNFQISNPCITAPPSNRNAFPATDRDGLASAANNWLWALNCGGFGCPPGWSRFNELGVCRPSGDWALAATWSSLDCVPGFGACCKLDGSCEEMFESDCVSIGGTYQGDGTDCADVDCPIPTGSCCFSTGFCLELSESDCTAAGGTYGGHGTDCADNNGNGEPDACELTGCDADRNADGLVDFFDLQDFLNDYSAMNASADMNGDGQYDFFDVQIYLNLFSAGCP
jgi:hypothetical protein